MAAPTQSGDFQIYNICFDTEIDAKSDESSSEEDEFDLGEALVATFTEVGLPLSDILSDKHVPEETEGWAQDDSEPVIRPFEGHEGEIECRSGKKLRNLDLF